MYTQNGVQGTCFWSMSVCFLLFLWEVKIGLNKKIPPNTSEGPTQTNKHKNYFDAKITVIGISSNFIHTIFEGILAK